MKKNSKRHFIPVLTTEAGRCLTTENWEEVGVKMASYDLTSLLMKPGFDGLTALPNLATYVGWQGSIVLNATMPAMDNERGYTIRSEYDGSRQRYTADDILLLIEQLKPQFVLLPEGMQHGWHTLSTSIMPFFAATDLPSETDRAYGLYFIYNTATPFSSLIEEIKRHGCVPCCVVGEFSVAMMDELRSIGVQYIASNKPSRDACEGDVYHQEGMISLKDEAYRMDFRLIDDQCRCPTCEQKLTRAYLHHLLAHTPLLCQRFLIQHNVSMSLVE